MLTLHHLTSTMSNVMPYWTSSVMMVVMISHGGIKINPGLTNIRMVKMVARLKFWGLSIDY